MSPPRYDVMPCPDGRRARCSIIHTPSGLAVLPQTTGLANPTTQRAAKTIADIFDRIAPYDDPTKAGQALADAGVPSLVKTWIDPRFQRSNPAQHFAPALAKAPTT